MDNNIHSNSRTHSNRSTDKIHNALNYAKNFTFFGFLGEFWNGVAAATADTVEWFQSVGNAVAGALGAVIIAVLHPIIDLVLLLYYVLVNIKTLFQAIFTLPTWLYNFTITFFSNLADLTPVNNWDSGSIYFLNSIPFWNTFGIAIGVGLIFSLITLIYKTANA